MQGLYISTWAANIFTCLWVFILTTIVSGTDYYCEGGESSLIQLNDSIASGNIHTLLEGETFYGDNRYCEWVIDVGSTSKRIHLKILSTDLQWAPESAICTGYDYVNIKDGNASDSRTIVLWCGSRNPHSVTSTGHTLTILFQSNPKNQYKYSYRGVNIRFQTFDVGTCPPEWTSPSTSDPNCYRVVTYPETSWTSAQIFCNYNQANLAVILTQEQQDYLKAIGQSSIGWIGLNKIALESEMTWINGSSVSVQYFATQDHQPDEDCVLIDFSTGEWRSADCLRSKAHFVCQTNKRGLFPIYKVPEERKTVQTQSNIAVILAGVLGSLVVVGSIIAAILVYIKCCAKDKKRKQEYTEPDTSSQSDQLASSAEHHSANSRQELASSARQQSTNRRQGVASSARQQTGSTPLAPSAPIDESVLAAQLMFLNSHTAPLPPPTYEEAVNEKGPVYL